jgi:tetratricopeptide (TPR) repeat protein/predicted Ser/Thr protein kinase
MAPPEEPTPASNDDTTTAGSGAGPSEVSKTVGISAADSLPGYEIVRELHRGGQGVVYQAIQKGTKRKVAVKVIREGPFADSRDRARFEREIQILGQLEHPNIVDIHESGTSASGHFYYVMDYVRGQPLDVYIAERDLSLKQMLELFAKICEAVAVAHLHGVIHRDLKPGNIHIDTDGEPHILDFGLAKVAAGQATGDTHLQAMTRTGQFIGSLPWASPEQAAGVPNRIDVRTDVYSLGVILYQMLTGRFPYEVVGNLRDVLNNILTTEPARPSTIRREINDEVETIVLNALAKEPERRYQSAGSLAEDVQRFLRGEPIRAKGDSALYVLRKRLRRNAKAIGVVAAFVVVLGALMPVAVVQWERNRRLAERERVARARSLYHDASELFWQRRYDEARASVEESLALDDTHVDARVLKARVLGSLGRRTEAVVELENALAEHPEAAAVHMFLAALLREVDAERAKEHLRIARDLGPDSADYYYFLAVTKDDVQECIALLSQAIELDPGHFSALLLRSVCYHQTGEFNRMLTDALRARSVRANDARAAYDVGVAYVQLGLLDEAVREFKQAVALDQGFYKAWFNLGWALHQLGDLAAARAAYGRAADLNPREIPPQANLAAVCEAQREFGDAMAHYSRLIELDPHSPRWPIRAAFAARRHGQWAEAIDLLEEAAGSHPADVATIHRLAWTYLTAPKNGGRDIERGLGLAREVQQLSPNEVGLDTTLALGYLRSNDPETAVEWAQRSVGQANAAATDHFVLGMCRLLLGENEAALKSYERGVSLMSTNHADVDLDELLLRDELAQLLRERP